MPDSEAVAVLVRGLLTLAVIALAYSALAVYIRERYGRSALLRLVPAAALLLFAGGSFNLWASFHAAGATQNLTPKLFGLVALGVCIPLAGSTWVISRQRSRPGTARLIVQSFGGMAAFWGSLFLVLVPTLLLDAARFFGW